jgi:hypothetical protein
VTPMERGGGVGGGGKGWLIVWKGGGGNANEPWTEGRGQ